jgi:hypothetical protein
VSGESAFTYGDGLSVFWVVAVFGEDAEESFFAIEGLADLVEALNESYNKTKFKI